MKLSIIPLSKIDFDNETFFVGPRVDISALKNSINEVGLINPPVLREEREKFQIICGRKRLEACRELGFSEVLSKGYERDEISDEECLKLVFYENRERFGDMERAELLLKFKKLCNLNESELTQRVLPYLGISSSLKNFEKYMRLAELEREIKDAFYSQRITIEQALILSDLESSVRTEILKRVLLRFKLNTNETREFVREIQEVGIRDKKSVDETIDEILSRIDQGEVKGDFFRRELKLMRYPVLSQIEEEFRNCLKCLNLPKEVNIYHPPFFEGNYVEIRMRIESAERFSQILSYLISVIEKGFVDRLVGIVREGRAG
jgi:ParB/RepB/Spo0J family partition protein